MIVKKFVENYIEPNSLIRLWYKTSDGGYI